MKRKRSKLKRKSKRKSSPSSSSALINVEENDDSTSTSEKSDVDTDTTVEGEHLDIKLNVTKKSKRKKRKQTISHETDDKKHVNNSDSGQNVVEDKISKSSSSDSIDTTSQEADVCNTSDEKATKKRKTRKRKKSDYRIDNKKNKPNDCAIKCTITSDTQIDTQIQSRDSHENSEKDEKSSNIHSKSLIDVKYNNEPVKDNLDSLSKSIVLSDNKEVESQPTLTSKSGLTTTGIIASEKGIPDTQSESHVTDALCTCAEPDKTETKNQKVSHSVTSAVSADVSLKVDKQLDSYSKPGDPSGNNVHADKQSSNTTLAILMPTGDNVDAVQETSSSCSTHASSYITEIKKQKDAHTDSLVQEDIYLEATKQTTSTSSTHTPSDDCAIKCTITPDTQTDTQIQLHDSHENSEKDEKSSNTHSKSLIDVKDNNEPVRDNLDSLSESIVLLSDNENVETQPTLTSKLGLTNTGIIAAEKGIPDTHSESHVTDALCTCAKPDKTEIENQKISHSVTPVSAVSADVTLEVEDAYSKSGDQSGNNVQADKQNSNTTSVILMLTGDNVDAVQETSSSCSTHASSHISDIKKQKDAHTDSSVQENISLEENKLISDTCSTHAPSNITEKGTQNNVHTESQSTKSFTLEAEKQNSDINSELCIQTYKNMTESLSTHDLHDVEVDKLSSSFESSSINETNKQSLEGAVSSRTRAKSQVDINISFNVLIPAKSFDKNEDSCFVFCGPPLSNWNNLFIQLRITKFLTIEGILYFLLKGDKYISRSFIGKTIPYKYVVVYKGTKRCFENFEEENRCRILNRQLLVEDSETGCHETFDDVVMPKFKGLVNCSVSRQCALTMFLPNWDDLHTLSMNEALNKARLILRKYANRVLVYEHISFSIIDQFCLNRAFSTYFNSLKISLNLCPVKQNYFNVAFFLCILTHEYKFQLKDVNDSNVLFTLLKQYLVSHDENVSHAFETQKDKDFLRAFREALLHWIYEHMRLLARQNSITIDYGTWLIALPYLKECCLDTEEYNKLEEDILRTWDDIVKSPLENLEDTIQTLANRQMKVCWSPLLHIASKSHFMSILKNRELLDQFHKDHLLQKFLGCLADGSAKQIEAISDFGSYLYTYFPSCENPMQYIHWIDHFKQFHDKYEKSLCKDILFFIIKTMSFLLKNSANEEECDMTKREANLLQTCLTTMNSTNRLSFTDTIKNYSEIMELYFNLNKFNEIISNSFLNFLKGKKVEICQNALFELDFDFHHEIAKLMIEDIFSKLTESCNAKESLFLRIVQIGKKLLFGTKQKNFGLFVSRIILYIDLPSEVNLNNCVEICRKLINSSILMSILNFVPQMLDHFTPEAKNRWDVMNKGTIMFFELLRKGDLTLETVSNLDDETRRHNLTELLTYYTDEDSKRVINMRIKEFHIYCECREIMTKFISHHKSNVNISFQREEDTFKHFCGKDHLLKDVCEISYNYDEIDIAKPCKVPVSKKEFFVMEHFVRNMKSKMFLESSEQFITTDTEVLEESSSCDTISFEMLIEKCEDVLDNFNLFLTSLCDGSIVLRKVKHLFYGLYDAATIDNEFSILKEICDPVKWNDEISNQVKTFFDILNYASIAEIIQHIKTILHNEHVYSIVDDILLSTNQEELFLDKPLNIINENSIHHGSLLSNITPVVLEALKTFCGCMKLIDWLRSNVKSVQEFKVFIDLANISAGETDVDVDKVMCLQSAVMAYSAFFFDLSDEPSIENFLSACCNLKYSIERDPDVTKKLEDSNRNVRWIESIKDRHGSVEESSLNTVQQINATGVYTIGLSPYRPSSFFTRIKFESFSNETSDTETCFREMNLDELNELESKLMLVSVSEGNKLLVDRFSQTLHQIILIFKKVQELIENGCHLFSQWNLVCFMDSDKVVSVKIDFGYKSDIITGQSKLEEELSHIYNFLCSCQLSWNRHIQQSRRKYSILNNFTTNQLIRLSDTLARFNCTDTFELDRETEMLIRMVVPNASPENIINLLKKSLKTEIDKDLIISAKSSNVELIEAMETDNETSENGNVSNIPATNFIDEIVETYGFDKELVQIAIKKTGEMSNSEIIATWCLENEDKIEYFNKTVPTDDMSSQIIKSKNSLSDYLPKPANETSTLLGRLDMCWTSFLSYRDVSEDFIKFPILASVLETLTSTLCEIYNRTFPEYCKKGLPNLIVCDSDELHASVLSLYQYDPEKPLPSLDEVLVCSSETPQEQVELLCLRAFNDKSGKIFSLIHADLLDFDTSCFVEQLCLNSEKINNSYQLVFFSNKKNDVHSFISTAFESYRTTVTNISRPMLRLYLEEHLKNSQLSVDGLPISYSLMLIGSDRSGNGKSLIVNRISQTQGNSLNSKALHQANIDNKGIVDSWNSTLRDTTVYHLDITDSVSDSSDDLLFSLAVLRGLIDNLGRFWKCSHSQIYLIELTLKDNIEEKPLEDSSEYSIKYLLPTVWCKSPQESLSAYEKDIQTPQFVKTDFGYAHFMDQSIFFSEDVQRPYQYLSMYTDHLSLDGFSYGEPYEDKLDCLTILLRHCCVKNPTWVELLNFSRFLNVQLVSCERSVFCNEAFVKDTLPNFKSFVVKFLICMSKDFATCSSTISDESISVPTIIDRNRWENNPHPYIFFNQDGHTLSIFGFQINEDLSLIDEKKGTVIEENIMSRQLYDGLSEQGVTFNKDISNMPHEAQRQYYIENLATIFGVPNFEIDLEDNFFELTHDNVLKMLAIHMRFKANIPVIIMGETGTGKTRLIKFLCDLQRQNRSEKNLIILKCHGGVTELNVYNVVKNAILLARQNIDKGVLQTILFFDEANTTNAIGAIKEVMSDGLVDGIPIPKDIGLMFIAAVNPYREHSPEMINKLESAGLGYHVRAEDTTDKIGKIPMRRLVYRVNEISPGLLPLIWDFGVIDECTEKKYISQMVQHYGSQFDWSFGMTEILTNVLSLCQEFMRSQKDECSFVSLRDIERTLNVFVWFFDRKDDLLLKIKDKFPDMLPDISNDFIFCIIWSIGVTYYVRLENRSDFVKKITFCLDEEVDNSVDDDYFENIIHLCQDLFIQEFKLDCDISRNEALKENIWMMTICIELRIPLFLVGKPGSSKSLSKTVVTDIMQGESSYSVIFKKMKEIQMISFQCSPLATADGICSTFSQCQKFQQKQDLNKFTAVVVLDEVGLAEDSPKMPLKSLHPLLEDGCIDDESEPQEYKKVAFIGISNWALDPAKMNRGVFVSRGTPSKDDLKKTARGICSDYRLLPYIDELVEGYYHLYINQPREYYGLRDFYSLIKMLHKKCLEGEISPVDIIESIGRCFDGCIESFKPISEFVSKMTIFTNISTDLNEHGVQKKMILNCLNDKTESRYLLFLTKNNAALRIIQDDPSLISSSKISIIFGSSFPHDQQYTHLCRNINKIKMSMELGHTIVLCNLTNLYESLYDALNQSYVSLGGSRYVDLGLGTHRVKCRVHRDFRMIVIAEDTEVYEKFPIPLINRLEKHFFGMETLLSEEQSAIVEDVKQWAESFSQTDSYTKPNSDQFTVPGDVFIGYHDDAPASIVHRILADNQCSGITRSDILDKVKETIIACATPDSISRLSNSRLNQKEQDNIFDIYHSVQHHSSIYDFLIHANPPELCFLAQITTHCRLMTVAGKTQLANQLKVHPDKINLVSLQQIDTEEQLEMLLHKFLSNCDGLPRENILIVQIDLGLSQQQRNILECARYCIQNSIKQYSNICCTILLLIHLPRVTGGTFTGFPSAPWTSIHIDEIFKAPSHLDMKNMKDKSISTIFSEDNSILNELLLECCPRALSKISMPNKQFLNFIEMVTTEFQNSNEHSLRFISLLKEKIVYLINKHEDTGFTSKDWLVKLASQSIDLKEGCTFQQTVWLHFVKSIVPHFEKLLVLCNLDCGLCTMTTLFNAPLKTDVELFFLDTFSQLSLNDTLFNFTEITRNKAYLPNNFQAEVPLSWVYLTILDRIATNVRTFPSEITHSASSFSSLLTLLNAFCMKQENLLLFIRDMIAFKMPTHGKDKAFLNHLSLALNSVIRFKQTNKLDKNQEQELLIEAVDVFNTYLELEHRILFFGKLVNLNPDILLQKFVTEISETFLLDISSIEFMLNFVEPDPKKLLTPSDRRKWTNMSTLIVHHLRSYFNVVETNNTEYPQELIAFVKTNQFSLIRLDILRLYLDFVVPSDAPLNVTKCLIMPLKLLSLIVKDGNLQSKNKFDSFLNFLKKVSRDSGRQHFSGGVDECFICKESPQDPVALECMHVACFKCIDDVRSKRLKANSNKDWNCPAEQCKKMYNCRYKLQRTRECQSVVESHNLIRKNLNSFFIEVLQRYIFDGDSTPEIGIINSLLNFVVTKKLLNFSEQQFKDITKDLSLFPGDHVDDSPVIRSSILQFILKCEWNHAREYLESFINAQLPFLDKSQYQDLYCLIIHAIQDSILSSEFKTPPNRFTVNRLERNCEIDFGKITLMEKLLFIAETQHDFDILADAIYKCVSGDLEEESFKILHDSASKLAIHCNSDHLQNYLVRKLCITYRMDFISQWKSSKLAFDLLPKSLQNANLEYIPDIFLICGENYTKLRNSMKTAIYEMNLEPVADILLQNSERNCLFWCFALMYLLIIERDETIQKNLSFFTESVQKQNARLGKITAEFLPNNVESSVLISKMPANTSPQNKSINLLLYRLHQVALHSSFNSNSSELLWLLCNQPTLLQTLFLPTMPQDDFYDTTEIARNSRHVTQYYRCPNGHLYGVGDCGHLNETSRCNECGTLIGQGQANAVPTGALKDTTRRGHILGDVQSKTSKSVSVRSQTALQVALTRFILHGCMFISTIFNPLYRIEVTTEKENLQEFLLEHLQLNFNQITQSMGQGEDATIILLHTIIDTMTNSEDDNQGNLESKTERQGWEENFARNILDSNIRGLNDNIKFYQNALRKDSASGEHVLFEILQADNLHQSSDLNVPFESTFWHYRHHLTPENLVQWLETRSNEENSRISTVCPTLFYLIENREVLSYTSSLIPIIRLQTNLVRLLSGRLDAKEVDQMTVRQFLFTKIDNPHRRDILREQIAQYFCVLSKLTHFLFRHDRYGRAAKHYVKSMKLDLSNPPRDITQWPAGLLLPCNKGYGLCAKVLASFLINAHNAALLAIRQTTSSVSVTTAGASSMEEDPTEEEAEDQVATVNEIGPDSIVSYQANQIHLLILTNSRYELRVGPSPSTATHVDHESLERQIIDRYFRGKPRISETQDIPVFHFASPSRLWAPHSRPLATSGMMQSRLPQSLRHLLESELTHLPELCRFLALLHTTREFLQIGAASKLETPSTPAAPLLREIQRLSIGVASADQILRSRFLVATGPGPTVEHIDDLIELVQLLRSRRMLTLRQNPWYGMLSEAYQAPLPEDFPARALTTLLHKIPVPVFSDRLHFFIMDALSSESLVEDELEQTGQQNQCMRPDWELGMTLTAFFEDHEDPDAHLYEEHVPSSILVKHASSAFEAVVGFFGNKS